MKKLIAFLGWAFAAFFAFFLFSTLVMSFLFFKKGMSEVNLETKAITSDNGVGVVELSGEIFSSDEFRKTLKKFIDNEKIKSVVVRINSPGGSVGSAEEIYRMIKLADSKKPIVCSFGDLAASGGLYASMGCRKIVTNAGTITGSIGVILMMPNLKEITDKLGFKMRVIKSGKFKDAGSPFNDLTEVESSLFQTLVNTSYEQFVNVISNARGIAINKVKEFADGRIILGEEALKLGLVDEVGGLQEAANLALNEALPDNKNEAELVFPKTNLGLKALFENFQETTWINRVKSAKLLYLSQW